MAWEPVGGKEILKGGETYRLTLKIKAPFSTFLAERLRDAVRAGVGLKNLDPFKKMKSVVEITGFNWYPAPVGSRTGRSEPWTFEVTMRKVTPNVAPAVVYGFVALIVAATAAVLIAGHKWERFIGTTAESVSGTARTVLNPGLILAAFVVAVLALRR